MDRVSKFDPRVWRTRVRHVQKLAKIPARGNSYVYRSERWTPPRLVLFLGLEKSGGGRIVGF